ncbi:hypothetical protein [Tenacibaculum singaporense]|uniref:Uncharacterized protein n=1 Tax=Tenacibaculum singaporense TaxID=2358479 RepID=A0A3Q8RQY5_9FLAO|nr:hypothetical protein [Tenacibaculum singaporense]AZJ34794.1 hypothetical protein D6T69_04355 [Tenacibaculum singaporense]
MNWKIITENKRRYADTSYYLKAERDCIEGTIVLEIYWIENFMYDLTVYLYRNEPKRKFLFFKSTKPETLYSCLVFYNGRIEKYGHQIMRMTEDAPLEKLKRLDSFQKDGVLNYKIGEKYSLDFTTTLPEKNVATTYSKK